MIVGKEVVKLLNEFYGKSDGMLTIVETGCLRAINDDSEEGDGWSTLHIASWIAAHPDCKFISIDINPESLKLARLFLGSHARFVTFLRGESWRVLGNFYNIDFAFLDTSDDPENGLSEFKAAEKCGAKMIVMDDYGVKTPLAEVYAKENGWQVSTNGRLVVMRK